MNKSIVSKLGAIRSKLTVGSYGWFALSKFMDMGECGISVKGVIF